MIRSKKAQAENRTTESASIITALIILLIGSAYFVMWIILLISSNNIEIDEKKSTTQIVINQLLDGCFSEEFGVIERDQFIEERILECLEPLPQGARMRLELEDQGLEFFIPDEQETFEDQTRFCAIGSTILCTEMHYPVTLLEESEEEKKRTADVFVVEAQIP